MGPPGSAEVSGAVQALFPAGIAREDPAARRIGRAVYCALKRVGAVGALDALMKPIETQRLFS